MRKLKFLLGFIGVVQIVLGLLALFTPQFFLQTAMKLGPTSADIGYPLGMFAARLLVVGAVMFVVMRNPVKHRLWIDAMIGIQIIDLLSGLYFTATGVVNIQAAGFPMFNAALFTVLLIMWRPKTKA